MNPLVSVHITTYNRRQELRRCVTSVWEQSYPSVEIIVVDDASTDGTEHELRLLEQESPFPLRFAVHTGNRGNAAARNTALSLSNGEYVAFLDDDDEWIDPEKLHKQMAIFNDDDKIGIVCSRARVLEPDGEHVAPDELPDDMYGHILRRNGVILNSTVITPRRLLDQVGGFDTEIGRGVDSDYFRSVIVSLRRSVFMVPDATVLVHAEHEQRMTSFASKRSLTRELHSQRHTLRKFKRALLGHPGALLYRFRKIAAARGRLLAKNLGLR